ncbi:LacI family DNA-binding transcriptional regulator [Leifsonia shinshuensis]|uniref:LacI family DNA-binding transcriptional regulator n=1 Tax=Leifsonia shinshuensis TaxID=150026 RepID=UPI00286D55BF|nr:LacI family DNA-binding transcriptional regulator [Leifsonia shinshuensis]
MSPAARRPTIRDVAALAGVSAQTVSRVVNGSRAVSPSTRDRVLTAIRELGYQPDSTARALRNGLDPDLSTLLAEAERRGDLRLFVPAVEAARRMR